jgi:hypothetical protein
MTNFLISNTIRAAAVLTNKMEKGVVLVYMFFRWKISFFFLGFETVQVTGLSIWLPGI